MKKLQYKFSGKTTTYYFDAGFAHLEKLVDKKQAVLLTDENIFRHHQKKFGGWNTIVIKAGEAFKVQDTIDSIVEQLIGFGADRKTFLVEGGGGVGTHVHGYGRRVYVPGRFLGFRASSIRALRSVAIGAKQR